MMSVFEEGLHISELIPELKWMKHFITKQLKNRKL